MSIIEKALDKALGQDQLLSPRVMEKPVAPPPETPPVLPEATPFNSPERLVAEPIPRHPPDDQQVMEETPSSLSETLVAEPISFIQPEQIAAEPIPPNPPEQRVMVEATPPNPPESPVAEAAPPDSPEKPPEPPVEITRKMLDIDWLALKSKGMLVPEMASTQLAEEYRVIKRPLLMNAFPDEDNGIERANLILVTSSVPGEGKTFTAMNLALSIAMERDKWVLLIDADVAKPSIGGLLGSSGEAGLTDLLKDKNVRFSDVTFKTDIPNLTIMPAGRQDRNSTELLASDAMKRLVKELSARYDDRVVIFDSPPLLAATQGAVLAGLVGQVVLVVEADSTPQYIVQESLSKLEACDVVGCVLNKTNQGLAFNYYSYFYGYGYGYGYGTYGQQQQQKKPQE